MGSPDFFGGQHVFQAEAPDAIMSSERGKPGWMKTLIDGFLQIRNSDWADEWRAIESLYSKDLNRVGRSPFADPLSLRGRLVMPARTHSIVHGNESQLFIRNPKCFVKPSSSRQEAMAEIWERHLNAHWERDVGLPEQIRLCIRDVGKFGFSFMTTECYQENPHAARLARNKRRKIARMLQEDVMAGDQIADQIAAMAASVDSVDAGEQKAVGWKRDSRVVYKRIVNLRTSPWNIAVDPNATCIEDAEWIFENELRPLEYVKREPSFKNTAGLKASSVLKGPYAKYAQELSNKRPGLVIPEAYQYVSLWRGYMRNDEGGWDYKVFAEDHDEWLVEEEDRYDLGCPYSMCRWNHTGDQLFCASDVGLVLDQIVEEIQLRTKLFDSRMRGMNDLFFFDKTMIGDAEMNAAVNFPGVGRGIPVENLHGRDINQVITWPRKPDEAMAIMPYLQIIERDITMGIGNGPNQNLQAMKSDTSATESAIIEQRAQAMASVKEAAFSKFVANVGHKIIQQSAQFYGPEEIAQTAGHEAAAAWAKEDWTPDDIRYGLAVTIEKGSMVATNDETRYQVYTELVSEALTNPMASVITNVPEAQRRRLLARGIQDGSALLMPGVSARAFSVAATQMNLMKQGAGAGGSPPAEKPPGAEGAEAMQPAMGGAA